MFHRLLITIFVAHGPAELANNWRRFALTEMLFLLSDLYHLATVTLYDGRVIFFDMLNHILVKHDLATVTNHLRFFDGDSQHPSQLVGCQRGLLTPRTLVHPGSQLITARLAVNLVAVGIGADDGADGGCHANYAVVKIVLRAVAKGK